MPALIDDSVTAGMPLVATVFVDDGEALDPHIAQAAYRIVQELLTNARKHASTVSVRLSVTGGPTEGISSSRRRTTFRSRRVRARRLGTGTGMLVRAWG